MSSRDHIKLVIKDCLGYDDHLELIAYLDKKAELSTEKDLSFFYYLEKELENEFEERGWQPKMVEYDEENNVTGMVRQIFERDLVDDLSKLSAIRNWMLKHSNEYFNRLYKRSQRPASKLKTFVWLASENVLKGLYEELIAGKFIRISYEDFKPIFGYMPVSTIRRKIPWWDVNKKSQVNKKSLLFILMQLKQYNFINYEDSEFNKIVPLCFCDRDKNDLKYVRQSKTDVAGLKASDYPRMFNIIKALRKLDSVK